MYLGKSPNESFDLDKNPDEMTNLWGSKDQRDVKARLVERLAELKIAAADRVPLPTVQA